MYMRTEWVPWTVWVLCGCLTLLSVSSWCFYTTLKCTVSWGNVNKDFAYEITNTILWLFLCNSQQTCIIYYYMVSWFDANSWVITRRNLNIFMGMTWPLIAAYSVHVNTWLHVCWPAASEARSKCCICWINICILPFTFFQFITQITVPFYKYHVQLKKHHYNCNILCPYGSVHQGVSRLECNAMQSLHDCYHSDVFLFSVFLTSI